MFPFIYLIAWSPAFIHRFLESLVNFSTHTHVVKSTREQSAKIERVYRGHVARMHTETLRQARILREIEIVRQQRVKLVAAGHLQSWWRGTNIQNVKVPIKSLRCNDLRTSKRGRLPWNELWGCCDCATTIQKCL